METKEYNPYAEVNKLKWELREKDQEIEGLYNMLQGNYSDNVWWLMTKVQNQRKALDALQKKGRGHTKEEREEMALAKS